MITDENSPEMIRAQQDILGRLGLILGDGTKRIDKYLMDKMFAVVKDHRQECLNRGIDFPVLVAVIVPRLGIVDFMRADLDLSSIRMQIVNFVRNNPGASMPEVVNAFHAAYPDLKPDDVLVSAHQGIMAKERASERLNKNIGEGSNGSEI